RPPDRPDAPQPALDRPQRGRGHPAAPRRPRPPHPAAQPRGCGCLRRRHGATGPRPARRRRGGRGMGIDLPEAAVRFLVTVEWGILVFFLFVNAFYLLLLLNAAVELRTHVLRIRGQARWKMLGSRAAPRISML